MCLVTAVQTVHIKCSLCHLLRRLPSFRESELRPIVVPSLENNAGGGDDSSSTDAAHQVPPPAPPTAAYEGPADGAVAQAAQEESGVSTTEFIVPDPPSSTPSVFGSDESGDRSSKIPGGSRGSFDAFRRSADYSLLSHLGCDSKSWQQEEPLEEGEEAVEMIDSEPVVGSSEEAYGTPTGSDEAPRPRDPSPQNDDDGGDHDMIGQDPMWGSPLSPPASREGLISTAIDTLSSAAHDGVVERSAIEEPRELRTVSEPAWSSSHGRHRPPKHHHGPRWRHFIPAVY